MTAVPPSTPLGTGQDARAREYENIQNGMFLGRLLVLFALLALYQFSGASLTLAEGLRSRFGRWWPITNGLYTLITVFGFSALMFPLSYYSDYLVERRFGLSKQSVEGWFLDYLKSLGIELALAAVFFEVVYALLRWAPATWWLWSAAAYVLFAVVLSALAPVLILPWFHRIEPLEDVGLVEAVRSMAERAGLKVVGVFRWGLEEKTETANAALAGLGRTRRILLGDTLLSGYTREEILAILAHELGHYRHGDIRRLILVGAALAAAGFALAHLVLRRLTAGVGFADPADIATFPLLVFCLFLFSVVALPVSNAYSRRREFAADAHAVRILGTAEPLVSALNKLAEQNLAMRQPPAWIELLLHGHPSIARRIARARQVEAGWPPPVARPTP